MGLLIFANSAKAEAPAIWICKSWTKLPNTTVKTKIFYRLIKFKSLNFLNKTTPFISLGDKIRYEAKVLRDNKCNSKIEKQHYSKLYRQLRFDFRNEEEIWINKDGLDGVHFFEYLRKNISEDALVKLSKKYSGYSLKNLMSKTEIQQVAKKEEPTEIQQVAEKEPTQEEKDLEKAKNKLEEEKRKIAEERKKLEEAQQAAEAAAQQAAKAAAAAAQEEKIKIAEEKRKKEEEEKNYRNLVKNYGSKCESGWSNLFTGHKVGTPEFDRCLIEMKNENDKRLLAQKNKEEKEQRAKLLKENQEKEAELLKIEKAEKEFVKLTPEEKRAYTCENTFGFRKGTDKFKCISFLKSKDCCFFISRSIYYFETFFQKFINFFTVTFLIQ